jgi:hypothetical protein
MVVRHFDLVGVATIPPEADSPLIVDPDAVLTLSTACQFLQTIPGRARQILESLRGFEDQEFP